MIAQTFKICIQHKKEVEVSGQDVREWLQKLLEHKVDFQGFAVQCFGSFSYGKIINGIMRIEYHTDIGSDMIKKYVSMPNELFTIVSVEKI